MDRSEFRFLQNPTHPWIALALVVLTLTGVVGVDLYHGYVAVGSWERGRLAQQTGIIEVSLTRQLDATSNAFDSIRSDLPWFQSQPNRNLANQRLQVFARALTEKVIDV